MSYEDTEYMFGIPLFTWEEWDEVGDNGLLFMNVEWLFPSMQKYNGGCVLTYANGVKSGMFCQNKADGTCIEEWKDKYLTDIPEFKEALRQKLE